LPTPHSSRVPTITLNASMRLAYQDVPWTRDVHPYPTLWMRPMFPAPRRVRRKRTARSPRPWPPRPVGAPFAGRDARSRLAAGRPVAASRITLSPGGLRTKHAPRGSPDNPGQANAPLAPGGSGRPPGQRCDLAGPAAVAMVPRGRGRSAETPLLETPLGETPLVRELLATVLAGGRPPGPPQWRWTRKPAKTRELPLVRT
jgi:hypothetical protein